MYAIASFYMPAVIEFEKQDVINEDKPNPYLRWTDRWEPLPDDFVPNYEYHGQNRSVPQSILVYNKVPRVSNNW